MKKEYVVTEITASPDGSPYVFVSLKDPKEIRGFQRSPLGAQVNVFTSLDELSKSIGKMITQMMGGGFATVIKLSLNEYEELNIKVGDKVILDISKVETVEA